VTFGDKPGYSNYDILLRCCRKDGKILKPSRPLTAIDAQIRSMGVDIAHGTRGVHSQCEVRFIAKIAKAKRIRFASLRRKLKSVRFAFASLFEGPNSPKSENFRRILAFFFNKNSFERGSKSTIFFEIFLGF